MGFKQFFTEATMNQNTIISDMNEILVGYYLNNEKWYDQEAKSKYEERLSQASPEDAERAKGQAKVMAAEFLKWAKEHRYGNGVVGVYWTARPNIMTKLVGVEVDQRKNPTDTLIRFGSGPADGWLGLSAKSTKGKGEIGFKNPGVGTVDKALRLNIGTTYKTQLAKAIQKLSLPGTDKARKAFIRSKPEIKRQTELLGVQMLAAMRDDLYNAMAKLRQPDLQKYIISDWMDAESMYPPYVKVTGQGKEEPYQAVVMDPLNNPKLEALMNNRITLVKVGNESIGVQAGNKKVMKIRFKFESEKLASSVKLSGEAW